MDKLHGTITTRVLETHVAVLLPLNQFNRNMKYELKKYHDHFQGKEIPGLFIHYKPCVVLHTNLPLFNEKNKQKYNLEINTN